MGTLSAAILAFQFTRRENQEPRPASKTSIRCHHSSPVFIYRILRVAASLVFLVLTLLSLRTATSRPSVETSPSRRIIASVSAVSVVLFQMNRPAHGVER